MAARALALRARHGLTGVPSEDAIDGVLRGEGLVLWGNTPLPEPIRELMTNGGVVARDGTPAPTHVVIAAGLSARWRRWMKAHALGHHALHPRENQFYCAATTHLAARREVEADVFAGWLLLGAVGVRVLSVPLYRLAEVALAPPEAIDRWLRLVFGVF